VQQSKPPLLGVVIDWIFFANQGEFTTGDYEEIMNRASCLSLVSNAILYWNTININEIVINPRQQGEKIDDETLSHISLCHLSMCCPMAPASLKIFREFSCKKVRFETLSTRRNRTFLCAT